MKIRNPLLISAAGFAGAAMVKVLARTLRVEHCHVGTGPPMVPVPDTPRILYMVWHENLLLPMTRYVRPGFAALVSNHADGQILATALKKLGIAVVTGSTQRGGTQAVRDILKNVAGCQHLMVTPDGPRGPRRVIQPGSIYIASRSGMVLVPAGIGYQNPWRANSWDRFAIPKPCTRAKVLTGDAIQIPRETKSEGLEEYRKYAQAEMERLQAMAERWAMTNKLESL